MIRARICAIAAMVGVLVYASLDIILQLLPPHYSPIREAESNLAVGPFGWIMAINFFGRGITSAALIAGLALTTRRTVVRDAGLILFGIAGACSAFIAFVPTDVPKGGGVHAATLHGTIHLIGASTGFVTVLAAFWLLTASLHRAGNASAFQWLLLVAATVGLAFVAGTLTFISGLFGLAERVCLLGILGWVFLTAAMVYRDASGRTSPSPQRTA